MTMNQTSTNNSENGNRKKKIAIAILLAVLLLGGGGVLTFHLLTNKSDNNTSTVNDDLKKLTDEQKLENLLKLAKMYIAREEYDRAMEVLEELYMQDFKSDEVLALFDDVLALKKGALLSDYPQFQEFAADDELFNQLVAEYEEIRNSKKDAARNAAKEKLQQVADEVAAQRRKELEALANSRLGIKNDITPEQAYVNEGILLIEKSVAADSDSDTILAQVEELKKSIPNDSTESARAFASEKLTELAQILYDQANKESDPEKKILLLNKAWEYVNEAVSKNPDNKNALTLKSEIQSLRNRLLGAAAVNNVADELSSIAASLLESGDVDSAINQYEEALKALPKGNTPEERALAAKRLNEMAAELYAAAEKETDPEKKAKLLKEAKRLADEALARNPD
nr:hypothetical protein [Treponema sp.]